MKRFKKLLAFLLVMVMTVNAFGIIPVQAASEIVVSTAMSKEEYTDSTTGNVMPYRLFVPDDYDASKTYPVVVFLHGAGERGNDNEAHLNNAIQNLFDTHEQMQQAIVIAPQCPSGKRWVETDWTQGNYDSSAIEEEQLATVMKILETVQANYSTDNDRIYAFGLSMGGFGTWNLLMNHSDVFAAGIPICGGADPNKTDVLKNIPIWTFHGTADPTVPYAGTAAMYNAITSAGGNVINFTTYTGSAHNVWNTAAETEGLIDWLFSQKLSERGTAVKPEAENLFDKTDSDVWMKALSYNGSKLENTSNYANIFTTHKIPVKKGDTIYWGGFAQENYVMELYAEDDTFLQQIQFADTQKVATGSTIQGVGTSNPAEYRYGYRVTNESAGYVRILGNISTMDSFAVYLNLEEQIEGWPYLAPATESVLNGKSILFAGDSITAAVKDDYNLSGWAGRIGTDYGMTYTNAGVSGASVSTVRSTNRVLSQIQKYASSEYDYLILHGGVNDAMDSASVGTMTDSFDVDDFDTSTFAGGLEELFYQTYQNFEGSRIGYIINYATPNSTWGGETKDMSAYFDMAKQICDKWNIPYIDLYAGTVEADGSALSYSYDILDVESGTNMYNNDAGEVHIGGSGYDLISPYIAKWVETLQVNATPDGFVNEETAELIDTYVKQLISYYKNYQDAAATDIERVLSELKLVDEEQAEIWGNIMSYWSEVNRDGFVNEVDILETGADETDLPTITIDDSKVAIVVLGFKLNSDGTMTDELIGRLQVGLGLANKYPDAYVIVTGGGTAANNPDVTEGGLMGDWLLEQGLDQSRLIVEDKAGSTVGNALNTYTILNEQYPQIESIIMVTSDYHVPRGSILFYSKFVLEAYAQNGKAITIVSNAGNETGSNGYESISLQASGVCSVAGVSSSSLPSVTLSVLESLTVTQESAYVTGNDLELTIMANYDNGYSKDVTDLAAITGFDKNSDATQTITISYSENDVTVAGKFALNELEKVIYDYESKVIALLAEVDAMDLSTYTSATREIVEYAYNNAQSVLDDAEASEAEVESAYNALLKAMDGLKVRENVALKKEVTASHNTDNAARITDGSKSTYWESTEDTNIPIEDTEIVIDLKGTYELDAITVVPYYQSSSEPRYYHYDVYVSEDNAEWTLVQEYRDTAYTTEKGNSITFDESTAVRYIKIKGVETYVEGRTDINNFHICEVLAYGNLIQAAEEKTVENLALYGAVTVDSGSNNYRLTDGKLENKYSASQNGITNAYAIVELPGKASIEEVKVVTYSNNLTKWYNWEVLVSEDNSTWTSVGKYEEQTNPGYDGYTIVLDTPVEARYVKVQGLATNNTNLHLVEIEVYGTMDNIALNKPVEASHLRSTESKYAAVNITDGALTNSAYWDTGDIFDSSSSSWDALTEDQLPYAVIDLKALYELDTVNVMSYYNSSRYYQYKVYTSIDGESYTLLGAKDDTTLAYFTTTLNAPDHTTARYIKVVGTYNSANPGFHLDEVRATGTLIPEETADYTAVNTAKAKVPADLSLYTAESVVDLKLALANVEEGLPVSQQTAVDAMAQAIEDAVAALEKKSGSDAPWLFDDVQDESEYYFAPVYWAYENGIAEGITENLFAPEQDVIRAEMVTLLWRAAGSPTPENTVCTFEDVDPEGYYYEAMLWAIEEGITVGYSDKEFGTTDTCTREQIVTFIWRMNGKELPETEECPFVDVNASDYCYNAVLWAVENGITAGLTKTRFAPEVNCTRGQAVTFLNRAFAQ